MGEQQAAGTLSTAFENMQDAVIATDERFLVTAWNQGAVRLYGWTADDVLGRHVKDLVAYRKDGTPVDVELVNVAISGERGEIAGYIGIHRDVTERNQAGEDLLAATRWSETILESITDAFVAVDRDWRFTYVNERALRGMQVVSNEHLTLDDVLGKVMWELFPEAVGTEIHERYHEAMRERRAVEFETYLPPSREWIAAHAYPSERGLAVYYRDITERKRAEQERERRARQQALVADLGGRALASEDLQPLMDEAAGLLARGLEVELVSVAEVLFRQERLVMRAGVGWKEGVVGNAAGFAGRGSLVAYTIGSGEPVVSEDLAADERFVISSLLSGHGAVSGATVAIGGRDEPFGVLGVYSRHRHAFSEHDLNFMHAVANVLATAVERTQADEALQEVREAERRRIARDLHDEALQELTQALALAQAGRAGSTDSDAADVLVSALKRVGGQLRGAIHDLRLDEEEDRPFRDALTKLVAVQRAMAVDCEVGLELGEGVPETPLGQRGTELLRIVGEALTNARRHASARNVRVSAWESEAGLVVDVTDDGDGFDPNDESDGVGGTGIRGMRERAGLVGADLRISRGPDAGTAVRVRLALRKDDHPPEQVRVLLVEDHATVREAIAAMFEREEDFEVTGQAASLAEARGMLQDVDVAVVDLGLPDGYGGDLIRELREANPQAQALVLSANLDRADIARAIESGAAGTLNKAAHLDEVVDAVRRLRAGATLVPLEEVVELLRFAGRQREQEQEDRRAIALLTPREREVLQALAEGHDSQEIADRLYITLRTERNHVSNILAKLGVHSQLQALVFALRYAVVEIR